MASRIAPQFYLVAVSIAAARYLGPQRFGRQSFIAFAEITVTMLCTAGFPLALTRYVGDSVGRGRQGAARRLVSLGWKVQAIGAAVAASILIGAALGGAGPQAAWLLAAVAAAAGVLGRVPSSLLTGLQRWRTVTLPGLAIGLGATVATIVALSLGGGITAMFAVEAIAVTLTLAVLSVVARGPTTALGPRGSTLDRSLRREVLRYAALSSVGVVITFVVWRRSELFVLQHYSTDTQIGFYAIAFSAISALSLAFQGLTATVFPATATLYGAGEFDRIRAGYGRATRLVLVAVLPVTAGALALGPSLLKLAYGRQYDGAVTPLVVLVAFLPLIPVANLGTLLLAAVGRLLPTLIAGVVAAGVNLGLDFALIPSHGALGAALANSAAQATVGIPAMLYAWRTLGGLRWDPGTVARAAAASVGGGLGAWAAVALFGGVGGFSIGLVAGIVLFGVLASALGILSVDDGRWLDETAGSLLGGRLGRLVRIWSRPSPEVGTP
jgi:O-antigen/teichoic acid export membrane protein